MSKILLIIIIVHSIYQFVNTLDDIKNNDEDTYNTSLSHHLGLDRLVLMLHGFVIAIGITKLIT